MYYHGVSVDDDTIVSEVVRLYHDHNNNGVVDHFISQGTIEQLRVISHSKLGNYKFTVEIIEEFGQPTIPEFVTASDRRRKMNEVVFWVENLRPLTEIYTDIPIHLPEIDVHFMTDQSLVTRTGANVWDRPSVHHISSSIIDINNALRLLNIRPEVSMRDLKTYVHETPASRTTTGSSRRPSSITYSQNGYSGTLTLYREDNLSYTESYSYNSAKQGSHTFSETLTSSFLNTSVYREYKKEVIPGSGGVAWDWVLVGSGGNSSLAPSSKSVSGSFSKSFSCSKNGTVTVSTSFSGSAPKSGSAYRDGGRTVISGNTKKQSGNMSSTNL